MRVRKPKVEYKLALQEKPQWSTLTYYYKTNNLTRINWLNTRLIIASNKIRHEIPFKTKRVKYTAIWKKSIKIVKESKLSFFYHVSLLNFFYSLLHNFIIFAPHSWISSSTILIFSLIFLFSLLTVIIPSSASSFLLFSLLLLLIFIIFPPPRFCVTFEDKTRSRTGQGLSKDPFYWWKTYQTVDGSRNRVPESCVPEISEWQQHCLFYC